MQLKEMPTEARERLNKSLSNFYKHATSTNVTGHRDSNGIRPPRSRNLKSSRPAAKFSDTASFAATDVVDSKPARSTNSSTVSTSSRSSTWSPFTAPDAADAADFVDSLGTHLPRIRTSRSPKSSADSSPSDSSPNQEETQRRAHDILLIREELMKHSIGLQNNDQVHAARATTLDPFVENSTSSWVNSLREPPPGRRGTASRKQGRQKEISENSRSSTSENEDKPARRDVDSMPASRTQKYANMTASQSRDLPTKPANAEETKHEYVPAVKNNSLRRSNSASSIVRNLTKPSNGHRELSPAQIRQRIPPDSPAGSATIVMPSGAKRLINLDSTEIFLKPQEARSSSARFANTRAGSSDGLNVDLKLDGAGPNHSKVRSLRSEMRDEKPADATRTDRRHASSGGNLKREDERPADTHKTNRRHAGTGGNLKREHDIAPDFQGRSPGRSSRQSLRHEGEADSVAGARRSSTSRSKDNFKREDEEKKGPADSQRTNRGGHLKPEGESAADFPGRSLRHEGESDLATGSRRRSMISRNKDNLNREDEEKKGPADTHRTNRRLVSNGGNLKPEDESAADFPGRSVRHEGESDLATGSRRRSMISRNKDNLNREDEEKKGPADTHRTNRRLVSNGGNLKREDDSAADFPGRSLWHEGESDLATASRRRDNLTPSRSLRHEGESDLATGSRRRDKLTPGRSLRHEGESDFATGSRRRSSSRNKNFKEENASLAPLTRQGSGRNLGSAADYANMHGRHYPTGGNLKQENVYNSAAGSRHTPSKSRKPDATKSAFPAFQNDGATEDNVGMPLTKVAAASYNGGWLPFGGMGPFPGDISGLNKFLDGCRKEVEAEVLGRYLTVVLGKENSDLDSMVSTIAYAYFLHCKINQESQYILPVINMRKEDFVQKNEAAWLFKVSGVDTSNFIFVDEISLPNYKKFGSLSLVLVDHSKLAPHQEDDLEDTVVTIIDHNLPASVYPSVLNLEIEEVGSCCTIIAEKYAAEAPAQLAGCGMSRLLLGPILLDTTNLDATFSNCTTRDEWMAALLIHGAGCYGRQGFFRYLRNLRFDVSHLSTKDVLTKEFMEWNLGTGRGRPIFAAMSSLGVPLFALLSRKNVVRDLRHFGRTMKLDFHLIVTGYFDNFDRYHREILVVLEDNELAEHIATCFSDHDRELKLSTLRIEGLPEQMLVYKQRQVTASRKIIRKILTVYFAR